jgi:hypothetical protein
VSDNVPQVEAQTAGKHNLHVALEVLGEYRLHCRITESFIHIPFLHHPRLTPNRLVRWEPQQPEEIAQRTLHLRQQNVGRTEVIVREKALQTFAN